MLRIVPLPTVTASPAPVLDDEHQQTTLERRLDAAILAAGACTPPRGLRVPHFFAERSAGPSSERSVVEFSGRRGEQLFAERSAAEMSGRPQGKEFNPTHDVLSPRRGTFDHPNDHRPRTGELVPLRLDPPSRTEQPARKPQISVDVTTKPAPRVLQFLHDDLRSSELDSVSRIPRLEPVRDSGSLPIAVGVHTNVYRLRGSDGEDTPARPLPAFAASNDEEADTALRNRKDKVATYKSAEGYGIDLRSFSSDDFDEDDEDDTHEGAPLAQTDGEGRQGRAVAAVALAGLSDEGVGELGTIDDIAGLGSMDDLDELARQLGMHGIAVPRGPRALELDDDLDEPDEISADDIELVAVPSTTEPFAAVVTARSQEERLALIDAADDDEFDDDLEVTAPRGAPISLLPASLFQDVDRAGDLADEFDDETPPRGTRPAIVAPQAVRFIVSAAPARPRHEALSSEDKARNKLRARDLYLVAMDDLGDGDPHGAMVHLELAIAYDDETSLYFDLLEQLKKKTRQ